jgi:MFS family permease
VRAGGQATPPADVTARRFRVASPAVALIVGGLVLALMIADAPLASLAHQSVNDASVPVWIAAGFAVAGFVVAWRKPRNPIGWVILALAGFAALGDDSSFYALADYRLRHGGLPLGWVALLAQLVGQLAIVLLGLVFLLFPDGRPPSSRWRWLVWIYATAATVWIVGGFVLTVDAVTSHTVRVDSTGNLVILYESVGAPAWWSDVSAVFFPSVVACWLLSLGSQILSYRRSTGDRRQQLKWLMSGSAIAGVGILIAVFLVGRRSEILQFLSDIALAGTVAIPVAMGVAILKYRLFDIDRVISRTLAYAIVTGLLVGVYSGLVLLATQVASVTTPVAVAASTLAAAALFNPLRRRVQRMLDRRFNRSRYDADQMVAAFAARLKDAVDLDSIRNDLVGIIQQALEPVHVWVSTGSSSADAGLASIASQPASRPSELPIVNRASPPAKLA